MEPGSENAALFLKYLTTLKPKKTRKPPLLTGHKVTFSLAYQRYHFNEMLYLAQMIVNAGGIYTLSTAEADTLYTFATKEDGVDTRLEKAKEMNENGGQIEIYPIKVLFELLETSAARLSLKPKMNLDHLPVPEPETETSTEPQAADEESGDLATSLK